MQEKREEKLADNVLDGIKQLQDKALSLFDKMEEQGDYRGAVLAAREARECILSANELITKAGAFKAGGTSEPLQVRVVFIGANVG